MSTDPRNKPRRRPPQLPFGAPTVLGRLSESFAFHSSPEEFIASRVLRFYAVHKEIARTNTAVHATILNRNVAIISSHSQIAHILSASATEDHGSSPGFLATDAYRTFMGPFYPSPNLLLSDGPAHACMRQSWDDQMGNIGTQSKHLLRDVTKTHFSTLIDCEADLYESLKSLTWRILLGLFLNLQESDAEFQEIVNLQEDLLRGQFSLFPVSLNFSVWQSPRSRGIAAKEKLQQLIRKRLEAVECACPFTTRQSSSDDADGLHQVANHVLLFTSSLAVKAIASLLTAYLLNIFLLERGGVRLVDEVKLLQGTEERAQFLRSIELETERLSPPIVGIMRRVAREAVIPSPTSHDGAADVLIPKGWDAWLYFVGGGRDAKVFGETYSRFVPDRFLSSASSAAAAQGFAFSAGTKKCLGQGLVREICLAVAESMLEDGLTLEGEVRARGVRAWLGWDDADEAGAEDWAKDMKQLPTQRPAAPVTVTVMKP